jgi:hypothetical protein
MGGNQAVLEVALTKSVYRDYNSEVDLGNRRSGLDPRCFFLIFNAISAYFPIKKYISFYYVISSKTI